LLLSLHWQFPSEAQVVPTLGQARLVVVVPTQVP
jgi:hypothetical protein